MKRIVWIILIGFFINSGIAQINLLEFEKGTVKVKLTETEEKTSTESFWENYLKVMDAAEDLKALTGRLNFGYDANIGEDDELIRLNGGVKISKNNYPEELSFTSQFNIQLDNGEFSENLTRLNVTYDRILDKKMNWEGFAFLDRTSNKYMNVNQRYEMGGGIILAQWGKPVKSKSNAYNAYMNHIIELKPDGTNGKSRWRNYSKNNQQWNEVMIKEVEFTGSEHSAFNSLQQNIAKSIRKENAKFRFGLLVGAFAEIEQISVSDSLDTDAGTMYFSEDFETTARMRWEIRPTVDLNFNNIMILKVRPYFKLPMIPNEWEAVVDGEKVVDYRIEMPCRLSFAFDGNFDFNVNYTYYYDNAPNSVALGVNGPGGLDPLYLTANKKHHYWDIGFTYKIK